MKQSDLNWLIGMGLSIAVNYFIWYHSPFKSLVEVFGLGKYLFWMFFWSTLVCGGFAMLMLNLMYNVKETDK